MNGYRVGELLRNIGGEMGFTYDSEWQNSPGGRPISLSLPIEKTQHKGNRVYNFFDNLLPDDSDIRVRIQRRFGIHTSHPFDLLSAIGSDCIGAIQLVEDLAEIPNVKNITAIKLTESDIASILRNYPNAPLGMAKARDEFRISLAGAQEKTAFLWYNNSWHLPMGATPTSHILKLPIGNLRNQGIDLGDSCDNEWLCMKIAHAFGLPVAEVEMQTFEDIKTLVIKRFDRKWSKDKRWLMRLPQEDFCQALGISPGLKYESDGGPGIPAIMDLLLRSESAQKDRSIFIKSQILFWLLAAVDGHGKNFSVQIQPKGNFKLIPLYDIMTVHPLIKTKQIPIQKVKLAMAVYGSKKKYYTLHKILQRHWLTTAQKVKYSKNLIQNSLNEIFDQVDNVISTVSKLIPSNFPEYIVDSTFQGMKNLRDRHS